MILYRDFLCSLLDNFAQYYRTNDTYCTRSLRGVEADEASRRTEGPGETSTQPSFPLVKSAKCSTLHTLGMKRPTNDTPQRAETRASARANGTSMPP